MIQQKTNAKAELLSSTFKFQEGIFQNALIGLTDELAHQRPSEQNNHINWLLGHLLHCRYMLSNMLGIEAENPFGNSYWEAIENKAYPRLDELVKYFPTISSLLIEKLSDMTDEELDAKPAPDKPSTTEIVSFFAYHEAYHLGQIGYARKMIGLDALKSN